MAKSKCSHCGGRGSSDMRCCVENSGLRYSKFGNGGPWSKCCACNGRGYYDDKPVGLF